MKTRQILFIGLLVVALMLAACGGEADQQANGDEESSRPILQGPALISATGEVLPSREATLSFGTAGPVVSLLVEVGDEVSEGDVIALLDTTVLKSEVAKAESAVDVAEANLALTEAAARPEQIAEAEQNLNAAAGSVSEAAASRDETAADATPTEVAQAKADVQSAYMDMLARRKYFDYVNNAEDNDSYTDYEQWALPREAEDAEEAYYWSQANLEAARAYLDDVLNGANADSVRAAEAEVWAASAEYLAAQADLNLLHLGSREEDIALAQANVDAAEAGLEKVRRARDDAILIAPFDGTISELYIRESEYVGPGVPILLIADLSGLRIETTDLNEIDVANISVGDSVDVTFDSLPGVLVEGIVESISPKAEEGTGVNFTLIIAVDELPELARWGMTVFIDIEQ